MDGAVPLVFLALLSGVIASFGFAVVWIAMWLFRRRSGYSPQSMALVAKTNVWIASTTFGLFLLLWQTGVGEFFVNYAAPLLFALSIAIYVSQRRLLF